MSLPNTLSRWTPVLVLVVFVFSALPVGADEPPPVAAGDLADLSLEDLMDLEITSVSKRAEKLSDSPAAIFVITPEDIRRSGATSIPEALRLVPGLHVAQISANRWAVSARGFSSEFANKLLVLIDGRSVYTPLFSGVFWDVQDTMLQDVERIEVIRGPGATLWGANAVNGVINIITRKAEDTQGGLLAAGFGSEERGFGSFRWGASTSEDLHFRVYGKYFDRDSFVDPDGNDAEDGWNVSRGGFRADWQASDRDFVTFQGDFYRGEVGERHFVVDSLVPAVMGIRDENVDIEGWNSIARWTREISPTSEASLQAYFDRTKRDIEFASEARDTVDLDFQHRFALGDRNDIVWGGGYRWTRDRTRGGLQVSFGDDQDDQRHDDLYSAFVQDQIELLEDRLSLTLGSKFEYNNYTGFEYQPSGRLLYKPHEDHTLWSSVSRAVRTPSRADDDVRLTQEVTTITPPPFFLPTSQVILLTGDDDLRSERLMAYEAGYRYTPSPRFSADLALFFNDYRDLRSNELVSVDPFSMPGAIIATSSFANRFDAETYGVELVSRWDVKPWLKLSGGYSYINIDLVSHNSTDPITENDSERGTPTHMLNLRSYVDLPHGFEWDTMLYWVENVPAEDASAYLRVDTRLGWQVREGLRLSLVLQNAQDSRHEEFGDTFLWPASDVERSIYGTVEWEF